MRKQERESVFERHPKNTKIRESTSAVQGLRAKAKALTPFQKPS